MQPGRFPKDSDRIHRTNKIAPGTIIFKGYLGSLSSSNEKGYLQYHLDSMEISSNICNGRRTGGSTIWK